MEILSGLDSLPDFRVRTPIVTWGVFDGVHRGHQTVLKTVLSWARGEGVSSVVVTFDRHPREVLQGARIPLVSPLGERLRLIGDLGIDFGLVLNFTLEFSKTSAEEFVKEVIAGRLRARGVVLGPDSRFGKDRTGDLDTLERLGTQVGLEVRRCDAERFEGRPVSSTLLRDAIFAGRLDEARFLLGRPPSVIGTAVRGDRRGTSLGFPTANLELQHAVRPPRGVYVVEVPLDGKLWRGVANLGTRPTFKDSSAEVLEVHLLDFPTADLYGRVLEVRFLSKVRDEQKFGNLDDLKRRIQEDIAVARNALR